MQNNHISSQSLYVNTTEKWKITFSKIVRIISIPPIMVLTLILILGFTRNDIFTNASDIAVTILCLAILPVLAYPLQKLLPGLKKKGREGQRSLAMILSVMGYLVAWCYGTLMKVNDNLMLIYACYLLSVVILLICNKGFHIRASGHACSVSGPIVFLCYFLGIKAAILCMLLYGIILWASLALKRHTLKEFMLGTATCIISFLGGYLIYIAI